MTLTQQAARIFHPYADLTQHMGKAIADEMDFQLFWMTVRFTQDEPTCSHCDRAYKQWGWLLRHYKRTGHWREATPNA